MPERLILDGNAIGGSLPSEIGQLVSIGKGDLRVYLVCLHICISHRLCFLLHQVFLYLFENSFVGTVPTELGGLSLLRK